MDLRIYTLAEVRKGGSMTKAPDLSSFPIPRKGGAKPMVTEDGDPPATALREGEGGSPEAIAPAPVAGIPPAAEDPAATQPDPAPRPTANAAPKRTPRAAPPARQQPAPMPYSSTVATTVKLDENRYLRLMEAGKPAPGRLKRRTIQDMVIEALDEWFERRGL